MCIDKQLKSQKVIKFKKTFGLLHNMYILKKLKKI